MIMIALIVVVIPSLLIIPLIFAATLFFLFRAPVTGLGNQIRTARYLFAYDNALEWLGTGRKRRAALVAELSANIVAAAADAPVTDVLARLGHPKDLAREYGAGPSRPTWLAGFVALVLVWAAVQYAAFASFDVLADTIRGTADAHVSAQTALLPGNDFSVATDGQGDIRQVTLQFGLLSWLAPLLAFAVFSRPWRLVGLRRRSSVGA